jgi:hypothetical protein
MRNLSAYYDMLRLCCCYVITAFLPAKHSGVWMRV